MNLEFPSVVFFSDRKFIVFSWFSFMSVTFLIITQNVQRHSLYNWFEFDVLQGNDIGLIKISFVCFLSSRRKGRKRERIKEIKFNLIVLSLLFVCFYLVKFSIEYQQSETKDRSSTFRCNVFAWKKLSFCLTILFRPFKD